MPLHFSILDALTFLLYSWWILLLCGWYTLFFSFLQDCGMYCMHVISLFHRAESSPFRNLYYLFTLSFFNKQTRNGRNRRSYFFLFICGHAKCLSRKHCVWSNARVDALCSSCSLQKYLEQWPAALNEVWRSVLMLRKGSKIPRIELNTVHFYQRYSLFMPNKLQYTWCGDYCECVRPAQLPVLTEVRAPSLLEQYSRYIPHQDRARYNILYPLHFFTYPWPGLALALVVGICSPIIKQ